jgi:ubiquinone biosynthesis protein UbiJ
LNAAELISPTLHTAAIAGLEAAINAALKLDPGSQLKLAQFEDHVFHWQCTSPKLDLYVIPGEQFRLCGFYEGEADTTLKGSAQEFFKLATAEDPANALINGDIELHGSSHALIELQKIGNQLEIDWEAPITDLFGDVLGHTISQGLREAHQFGMQLFSGLKRQAEDYLFEEADLTPAKWEGDKFLNQIDELTQRTDRLQAKFSRLKQRADNKA